MRVRLAVQTFTLLSHKNELRPQVEAANIFSFFVFPFFFKEQQDPRGGTTPVGVAPERRPPEGQFRENATEKNALQKNLSVTK
jgi:hypothetical protein